MTREELVEVMARAICAGQGLDWKDQFGIYSSNGDPLVHEAFKHDAASALAAIEAAGVRLVPVETSRHMRVTHMLAAARMTGCDDIELTEDEHRAMYAAFVAASPYALKEPGQ